MDALILFNFDHLHIVSGHFACVWPAWHETYYLLNLRGFQFLTHSKFLFGINIFWRLLTFSVGFLVLLGADSTYEREKLKSELTFLS